MGAGTVSGVALGKSNSKSLEFATERVKVHILKTESESHSVVSDRLQPMDYTVHGVLQARILVWVAFPFSSGSSQPRD